ncbi:MAG TPA: DUF5677 domain-containing protein, partial [Candidatus Angelobacter sp.]
LEFATKHQGFLRNFPSLLTTFGHVFTREAAIGNLADRVVFFLGNIILEDFMEILLLCGNGYGLGGFKLLRGLYERTVTAAYIAKNPNEAEVFLQYHKVHRGKLLNHTEELFNVRELFTEDQLARIRDDYQETKKNFQEPVCHKCGISRTQFSWSRLDVGSMAKKADPDLAQLYLSCYFLPTLQTHSTVSALFAQMKTSDTGGLMFNPDAQREKVDEALRGAHSVILFALQTQNDYFRLGLDQEIESKRNEFIQTWKHHPE